MWYSVRLVQVYEYHCNTKSIKELQNRLAGLEVRCSIQLSYQGIVDGPEIGFRNDNPTPAMDTDSSIALQLRNDCAYR